GETAVFPPTGKMHVDNIMHQSLVRARINTAIIRKAERIARTIAEKLNVVGVITVGMFDTTSGQIYVNERATRPLNSGQYTMEACETSQFEPHIRAVCTLPLGSTGLLKPVVMVNILGQHVESVLHQLAQPEAAAAARDLGVAVKLHLYGKKEPKHQRKM